MGYLLYLKSNPSSTIHAAVPANEKITASYDSLHLFGYDDEAN